MRLDAYAYCRVHEGTSRTPEIEGIPDACDNWGRFPQLDCEVWWKLPDGACGWVTTSENRYKGTTMRLDLGRRRVVAFTSESEPGRVHVVVLRRFGSFCTCDGFRFHDACWHLDAVRGRTRPLDRKGA